MKRKNNTLNFISTIILILVFLLLISIVLTRFFDIPIIKYQVIWVMSDSMEDTIMSKSFILCKRVDPKDIEVGDIITFRSRDPILAGNLNTHRVIEIIGDNEEFVTKGDNYITNPIKDQYTVFPEDIKAIYIRNLLSFSMIGRFFSTKAGLITTLSLILLGTVFYFVSFILDMKKDTKEEMINSLIEEEVKRLESEAESKGTTK